MNRISPARCAIALILTILSIVGPAVAAEATTGTLVGTVRDTSGAPIASARISAVSPSGSYSALSDAHGRFAMLAMTPDTYNVSVSATGFEPSSEPGVTVFPDETRELAVRLVPQLKTIATVESQAPAFTAGSTSDAFTVTGSAARALSPPVTSSGLANYAAGTIQGAIASVPGIAFDPFGNAILRGGQVDDAVFDFDSVPVPQGLIAEPGGNVVGAQLPTTGIASTEATLAGYETQGDNALGGVIDEIPAVGTYPGSTTLELADGIAGGQMQFANLQMLGATPDQRWRYALASSVGSEYFSYGDGHTFYPVEAGTYGLALQSRSQYAIEGNVHYKLTPSDDLSLLAFSGQASYNQYGTPYPGETIGAFDCYGCGPTGGSMTYPGYTNPNEPVTFPTGVRGSFTVLKAAWLHTGAHSDSRVQLYQSQFGASAGGPYWDENGFPNGTFSFFGQQSGRDTGLSYDGEDLIGEHHHLRYGAQYRVNTFSLYQLVPTFDETVRSNPTLSSYLAYLGDTWSATQRLSLMGALRLTGTHIVPSTGYPYNVGAIDPHVAAVQRLGGVYALRATFDHTTVAPKPLEADRYDSTNVNQEGQQAPFVTLAPETADDFTYSFEGDGKVQFRLTYYTELEKNRIDVLPFNYRQVFAGEVASPIGVPTNVGQLRAHGLELWTRYGGFTLDADYIRAFSSSASEFAYNNLNAPAIAAGHLFPVGYVPDLTMTLSYEMDFAHRRLRVEPSLSYETGYPYGVGKMAWTFSPTTHKPIQVPNDNYIDPGANYYFLENPSEPYNALTNPYVGSLGTNEGNDPNTLRSPPQTLVNLHVEDDLTPHLTAIVDVVNLFGNFSPSEYQTNPYLIGPPGYAGGNPIYASYYQGVINGSQPYVLGNGVPTNNGVTQAVPWSYGRAGYVPQSYPLSRTVQLRLRWRI
jgi:hypothetical protein